MSITLETGPSEGPALVARRLRSLRTATEQKALSESGTRAQAAAPLPLYTIPLDRLAVDPSPADAVRFGWRYITVEGDTLSVVDLLADGEGALTPHAVIRGRPAQALVDAGSGAEAATTGGTYEARILDLTIIGMLGLWMSAPNDSFVLDLYETGERLPLERFLRDAQGRAQDRLAAAAASEGTEDGG